MDVEIRPAPRARDVGPVTAAQAMAWAEGTMEACAGGRLTTAELRRYLEAGSRAGGLLAPARRHALHRALLGELLGLMHEYLTAPRVAARAADLCPGDRVAVDAFDVVRVRRVVGMVKDDVGRPAFAVTADDGEELHFDPAEELVVLRQFPRVAAHHAEVAR